MSVLTPRRAPGAGEARAAQGPNTHQPPISAPNGCVQPHAQMNPYGGVQAAPQQRPQQPQLQLQPQPQGPPPQMQAQVLAQQQLQFTPQQVTPQMAQPHQQDRSAAFNVLDRNHDGVISRTEWNQANAMSSHQQRQVPQIPQQGTFSGSATPPVAPPVPQMPQQVTLTGSATPPVAPPMIGQGYSSSPPLMQQPVTLNRSTTPPVTPQSMVAPIARVAAVSATAGVAVAAPIPGNESQPSPTWECCVASPYELVCQGATGLDAGALPKARRRICVPVDTATIVGRVHQVGFFEALLPSAYLTYISRAHFELAPVGLGSPSASSRTAFKLTNLSQNHLQLDGKQRLAKGEQGVLSPPATIDFLPPLGGAGAACDTVVLLRLLIAKSETETRPDPARLMPASLDPPSGPCMASSPATPSASSTAPPVAPSFAESRAVDTSSVDDVQLCDLQLYAESLAQNLSKGHDVIRQSILVFMEQARKLADHSSARTNIGPHDFKTATSTQRITVEVVVAKKDDHCPIQVSYKFNLSHLPLHSIPQEAEDRGTAFNALDRNHDGVISRAEWNQGVPANVGVPPPSQNASLAYEGVPANVGIPPPSQSASPSPIATVPAFPKAPVLADATSRSPPPATPAAVQDAPFWMKLEGTGVNSHAEQSCWLAGAYEGLSIGRTHQPLLHQQVLKEGLISYVSRDHFRIECVGPESGRCSLVATGSNPVWVRRTGAIIAEIRKGEPSFPLQSGDAVLLFTGATDNTPDGPGCRGTLLWTFHQVSSASANAVAAHGVPPAATHVSQGPSGGGSHGMAAASIAAVSEWLTDEAPLLPAVAMPAQTAQAWNAAVATPGAGTIDDTQPVPSMPPGGLPAGSCVLPPSGQLLAGSQPGTPRFAGAPSPTQDLSQFGKPGQWPAPAFGS